MSKIQILVVPSDQHGVGKFRSIDPHVYLQNTKSEYFHVDIDFNPPIDNDSYYKNYQIIHFHSLLHKDNVDIETAFQLTLSRIKWCKANGIKTIMDIDDYWMPDQYHPLFQIALQRKDNVYRTKILREVDYVTTTTKIFKDVITKTLGLKNNVFVFPNAIDPNEDQFMSKPENSNLVRFGWLGGSSHLHDIELLQQNVTSAHYKHVGKIQMVLCGFDLRGSVTEIDARTGEKTRRDIRPEETSWYQYEKFFTDNYSVVSEQYKKFLLTFKQEGYQDINEPYRRVWTKPINNYAENYNKMDVTLAPLKNTLFNSVKSQLKVIESGFHKKPIICTDFGPYQIDLINAVEKGGTINSKGNALLVDPVKNHKGWIQHINRLMESPAMREDLGMKLYETVKDKYSLATVTESRSEFYKRIAK
jgi:glycosyltransferase involved in cell wall biosynthesis